MKRTYETHEASGYGATVNSVGSLRMIAIALFATVVFSSLAMCRDTYPRPSDGVIVEHCATPSVINISLTDKLGAAIGAGDINGVLCNRRWQGQGFITPPVNIPANVKTSDGMVPVADWRQTARPLPKGSGKFPSAGAGPVSDLSAEAVFSDPDNPGKFAIGNVFTEMGRKVGTAYVAIPDLYADTNGDGTLDSGDVLYSLVVLNTYLNNIPTVNLGDTFSIVNGTVAGLDGMMFSTTPFVFNPDTGDFTGTDYKGEGYVLSIHLPKDTPEPSTLVLLGSSILGVSGFLRKRPRIEVRGRRSLAHCTALFPVRSS